jgi:predicted alpha/beta-fold hydrolase
MAKFRPAWGMQNRHIQTLYSTLFRSNSIDNFETQEFILQDGDFVDCYWLNRPTSSTCQKSIVTLFHGLTGSYQSPYIQGIMQHLTQLGYSCVLMHFRGCSGRSNRTARAYHSGDTADAKAWIEQLKYSYPNAKLFAIGYSLGANMLLKLLAEYQHNSPIFAAAAISAPLQLNNSAATLKKGFAKLYQFYLLRGLKKSLLHKYAYYNYEALIGLSMDKIKSISTIEEFDDLYTSRIHGFKSAQHYYQKSSALQYLSKITTNTLVINAKDDPFMQPEILPSHGEVPSNVYLEFPNHGGHLGFISGSLIKPEFWLEPRISSFFKHK